METTQTTNPLNFETVWAALMEDREHLKETERILKENAERYERAREKNEAEFNKKLGEYINLFGAVTEYTMAPNLRKKFIKLGFTFPWAGRNICIRDENDNILLEIDVLLENDDTAMLVEIKTQLTIDRIKYHMERLEKMRNYADLRGDKRTFLGAVAGVVVTDKARKYALDQGFYLIEPEGQDLHITAPNGKPKEW